MNLKKIIISLMILSLLVLSVFSCSSNDNKKEAVGNDNVGNAENIADLPEENAKFAHVMPEKDFGGYKFSFLVKEFDGNGYWGWWTYSQKKKTATR